MYLCVCLCLQSETERAQCVCVSVHCGELSIVTGAESGLLLPHLKEGMNMISTREEEKKRRENTRRGS